MGATRRDHTAVSMTRAVVALALTFLTIPACSQGAGTLINPAHDVSIPTAIRDSGE